MSKKEIKSTVNGFMVIDEDNNIIHEYDSNKAIEYCLKNIQECKTFISDWAANSRENQKKLNELTEQILNREKDTETPALMETVSSQMHRL